MPPRRARILLAGYLVVLALLTLIPVLGPDVTQWLVRLARGIGGNGGEHDIALVDVVTNVVLFVPAGLLLTAALPRARPIAVWLLCVAVSVGIELTQGVAVPGRDPSVVDVATNALGAGLGVLLALKVRRPVRRS